MHFWILLKQLLFLIGSALIFGVISKKLKQSAIIGYIMAGVFIGPFLSSDLAIREIAELGIALMMFSIGLEFSLSRLRQMGKHLIIGGFFQVTLTLLVSSLILVNFLSVKQSIVIGIIVALSSTAIVLRILADSGELDSIHGRICVGVLLTQDLAVIPLMMVVSFMSSLNTGIIEIFLEISKTLGILFGLSLCFYLFFHKIIPIVLKADAFSINREFIALVALVSALGSAWITHNCNLSPSLGAFIAGMLLGESPFSSQIKSDVSSLRIIFVTIFFVSVGMLIKPSWIIDYGVISTASVLTVVLMKTLITYIVVRKLKFDKLSSFISGLFLSQIGEFSFIIATTSLSRGLIDNKIFSIIVTSNVLSLLISPYLIKGGLELKNKFSSFFYYDISTNHKNSLQITDYIINPTPDIILVGYGPVGKEIARLTLKQGVKIRILEFNPRLYNQAIIDGFEAFLGDATRTDILKQLNLSFSKIVIISLADVNMSKRIILAIRMLNNNIKIYARGHYSFNCEALEKLGANLVVDEEGITGKELVNLAISELDSTISLVEAVSGENLDNK